MDINIGIAENDRKLLAGGLSHLLADTYAVYHKTHAYHWNVTGPMFNTLHLMFEGQYTELWQAVDEIAERIRALGHFAPGGYALLTSLTKIDEDNGVAPADTMIRHLVTDHETLVRTAREILPVAEQAGDDPTADIVTQRLQSLEKTAWMLRSMLEK